MSTTSYIDQIRIAEEAASEKPVTGHHSLQDVKDEDGSRIHVDDGGFEHSIETMPKGYYYSPFFLGSFAATHLEEGHDIIYEIIAGRQYQRNWECQWLPHHHGSLIRDVHLSGY